MEWGILLYMMPSSVPRGNPAVSPPGKLLSGIWSGKCSVFPPVMCLRMIWRGKKTNIPPGMIISKVSSGKMTVFPLEQCAIPRIQTMCNPENTNNVQSREYEQCAIPRIRTVCNSENRKQKKDAHLHGHLFFYIGVKISR